MSTNANIQIKKEFNALKGEVRSLRSFIISMLGKDTEGEYRPELVEELVQASVEKPNYTYTGAGSLLKQIKNL
ncbi:hypothetical protein HY630_00370 [Candidatus Uhrbacteria bacterium]|nr:hypothetical protein [Candidatus Uhrbacteria bacterium]